MQGPAGITDMVAQHPGLTAQVAQHPGLTDQVAHHPGLTAQVAQHPRLTDQVAQHPGPAVISEQTKATSTGKIMARFGWYAVERNHLYSIVNSPNKYIIHTSITGSALNYSLIYDISCKLFIEKTKHDCLPQDPLLWDRVPVRFTPTRNNPEFVIFKFGSETVKAWLPKEVYDVHVCVLKKQAFILSCQRMAHFQSILAQESLSLCDMCEFESIFVVFCLLQRMCPAGSS